MSDSKVSHCFQSICLIHHHHGDDLISWSTARKIGIWIGNRQRRRRHLFFCKISRVTKLGSRQTNNTNGIELDPIRNNLKTRMARQAILELFNAYSTRFQVSCWKQFENFLPKFGRNVSQADPKLWRVHTTSFIAKLCSVFASITTSQIKLKKM